MRPSSCTGEMTPHHLDLRDINEAVVAQAVVDVLTDASSERV
jgi:hypothetical protein